MKIDTLREFCSLAETLNFSATSKMFYMSPSVLSKHISTLETELGTKLFVRTTHSVSLTPLGKSFVKSARMVIAAHDEAFQDILAERNRLSSTLRVGYLLASSEEYLLSACDTFRETFPETELAFFSLEVDAVINALAENEIDLGIGARPVGFETDRYCFIDLFEDSFGAVVSKDSPYAEKSVLTDADLEGANLISHNSSFMANTAEAMQQRFGNLMLDRYNDPNSMMFLLQANRENWIGLAPRHLALRYAPHLKFIPIEGLDVRLWISAIWKKSREYPAVVHFAKCLSETAYCPIS